MQATLPLLEVSDFPSIKRGSTQTLQVNLGYLSNQRSLHGHVNVEPPRAEIMSDSIIDMIVPVLKVRGINTLDLTGGAPEMHSSFNRLVKAARAEGVHVIDRCNLTILSEPGYEGLADFLAEQNVEVIASSPCYSIDNVDKQRDDVVFDRSIAGLISLNKLGYGKKGSNLKLNLVYNPQGPVIPPDQKKLQDDYKHELFASFGIIFNELYVTTNMPIKRFGSTLISKGQFEPYMTLLKKHHNSKNLKQVMCTSLISVDWQGYLYDCDFNQQLDIPMKSQGMLLDLLVTDSEGESIVVADHCFGCTAGQGSSCGGTV